MASQAGSRETIALSARVTPPTSSISWAEAAQQAAKDAHGLSAEQGEQVLAKVGDTTITVKEFADRLASQSPYLRARYNSAERRKEFLDNMVRFELLAIEARKRGLHEQPEWHVASHSSTFAI